MHIAHLLGIALFLKSRIVFSKFEPYNSREMMQFCDVNFDDAIYMHLMSRENEFILVEDINCIFKSLKLRFLA